LAEAAVKYGRNMLDEARPFVKWAGGKRQLLDKLTISLPDFEDYHGQFLFKRRPAAFAATNHKSNFKPRIFMRVAAH